MSKSKPNVDCIAGEWRRPVNDLHDQHVGGGHKAIHDDATAAAAGFADAPVHGTVHWSQLTPLLLRVWGKTWFERGTISVAFKTIVADMQPVKAFIEKPSRSEQTQLMIWMEHVDGRVVFDGTASLGDDDGDTMVDRQIRRVKPVQGHLAFIPHPVGTETLGFEEAQINWGCVIGTLFPFTPEKKLEIISEWHPWFSKEHGEDSPWGRPILPPEALNQIMLYTMPRAKWPMAQSWLPEGRTPVGLFGGCEVKMHKGPCFVGEKYFITRKLIAIGETPKTEFSWTKTVLKDFSGNIVAEMTLQDMMLKHTVEGYGNIRAAANGAARSRL